MLQKQGNNWILTIPGNRGTTVLVITPSGTMWDKSGAPIIKSDVTIAMGYLDATMKQRVWDWWLRQPQARDY